MRQARHDVITGIILEAIMGIHFLNETTTAYDIMMNPFRKNIIKRSVVLLAIYDMEEEILMKALHRGDISHIEFRRLYR